MADTPQQQKAAADEAAAVAQKATDDAVAAALAEQAKAHELALQAERAGFAAKLAEQSGGATASSSTSSATKGYELLADVMHLPKVDGQNRLLDYTTYVRGDKVPLTKARADELIAAGAIKDPNAKADAGKPGAQTSAPGEDTD